MNTLKFGNSEWYGTEGNILAYSDTSNNYKPLPFTFSRGSSATRVNQQGLIETVQANDARVDYLNNANGALLLEPQRTNLVTQSNNLTSGWGGFSFSGGNMSGNYGFLSPDGSNNATRLTYTNTSAGTGGALLTQNLTLVANAVYTISFWAKNVSGQKRIRLDLRNSSSSGVSGTSFELTDKWQKYNHTVTNDNLTSRGVQIRIIDSEFAGNRVFDMWGVQLEQASYVTSTIPTQGTVQTRLADSCYQGGLLDKGVLNNNALTLFFNSTLTSDTTNQFLDIISMHHSTAFKEIRIESRTNNILYIQQGGVVNSGDNFNSLNLGSNSINFKKIAIVLTQTQFKVFADGSQIGSTLNGSYNVNFDSLGFQTFNGAVQTKIQNKEIKLYNTALSDSELAALTQV